MRGPKTELGMKIAIGLQIFMLVAMMGFVGALIYIVVTYG